MEELYDVLIVGGGPAGLTAALYLARSRYRVLVLAREQFGGQIAITDEVVNYPGVARVSGRELTDTMRAQAESFGAEFALADVTGFDLSDDIKTLHTSAGTYRALGVLLAVGAHPRAVGFRGEEEHKGRGVAYCATCDGEFFTGKDLFVVGGGFAAAEESVFLTKFARHVTILIRKADFSCAAATAERARSDPKITVLPHTVLEEVRGEQGLTYARYKNTATGEVTEVERTPDDSFGVFVFAGYAPATDALRGLVELNEQGYIVTDASQKTSVRGVYAAGDVCIKPLRQVVTATGDAAIAATALEKYVAELRRETGLAPSSPSQAQRADAKKAPPPAGDDGPFPRELLAQIDELFAKLSKPLLLKLTLDRRPVSAELERFITALAARSEKLSVSVVSRDADSASAPFVSICRADGEEAGLFFHGVPSGHEFSSFLLALYNVSGPGQPLDEAAARRIAAIKAPVSLTLMVTLSCTMCPALVAAAQRVAAEGPAVTTHVYDIRHFDALRERYGVMSVPCLVINDGAVHFGRKDLDALLSLLGV